MVHQLGSLHTVQHQQVGSRSSPCCKMCHRGLPHYKQGIRHYLQPWIGNPTKKTHRGKAGDDVQDKIYGLIDISATTLLHPATLSTRGNFMCYLTLYCIIDTVLTVLILSIRGTSLEPAARVRRHSAFLIYFCILSYACKDILYRCTVQLCVKEKRS